MNPTAKQIGLIGLGLMGRPMGMNLIKAGYSLTVWNRNTSRAGELVAAGAKLAKSPQEVAEASDFLLTIVSDPPAAAASTSTPAPSHRRWPAKSLPHAPRAACITSTRLSQEVIGEQRRANSSL